MIDVVCVDDDALVRRALRVLVDAEEDLRVVGEAADGEEALRVCAAARPGVVLMDIRMPVMDGVTATRRIAAGREPRPRVLVLTTFGDEQEVYRAFAAGASGFVVKSDAASDLASAVRVVAAGEALVLPASTRRLLARHAPSTPERDGSHRRLDRLTAREQDVLRELAAGRNNAEIAERLGLGVETARTHVGNVLAKLEVRDRTQAVVLAFRTGFVAPGG